MQMGSARGGDTFTRKPAERQRGPDVLEKKIKRIDYRQSVGATPLNSAGQTREERQQRTMIRGDMCRE
jgi:hypothetical protein